MQIKNCGSCGNCMDFICPAGAFKFNSTQGYASASIDKNLCTDCGLCLDNIDCLCEAIVDESVL
jgi:ferredoxin